MILDKAVIRSQKVNYEFATQSIKSTSACSARLGRTIKFDTNNPDEVVLTGTFGALTKPCAKVVMHKTKVSIVLCI